jgi:MscS family membrane protein
MLADRCTVPNPLHTHGRGVVLTTLLALTLGVAALPVAGQGSAMTGGSSNGGGNPQTADSVIDPLKLVGRAASAPLREDEGSVEKPRWAEHDGPRSLVMGFRENMRYLRQGKPRAEELAWPRVRAMLGADRLEGTDDASLREMAYALDRVFDRLPLQPAQLPGKQVVQEQALHRFEVFPRTIGHATIWSQLGEGVPDEEIVVEAGDAAEGGAAAWRFTAETVTSATDLLDAVRSARLQDVEPWMKPTNQLESLLRPTIDRMTTRDWLWAGGGALLGLVAGVLVWWALSRTGRELIEHGKLATGGIARQLAGPVGLGILFFGVAWGLANLTLGPTLGQWRWRLVEAMGAVVVIYGVIAAVGIVGAILQRQADGKNEHFKKTAIPLMVTIVQVVIGGLLVVLLVQMLLGVNVLATVAGFGIVGIAIGLAAQESVRNWFGAMTIFLARPFTEDDWIVYKGDFGQVERIGLNATRLRMVDGEVMTIPNMGFINEPISNATARQWLRRQLDISVPYDATPDEVETAVDLVRESLREEAVVDQGGFEQIGREPHVTFAQYNADHLAIRAYYWFRVPDGEAGWYQFLDHADTVNRAIYRRFEQAGQAFAFPTQTIRLRDETGEVVRIDAAVTDRPADDRPDDQTDGKPDDQPTPSDAQDSAPTRSNPDAASKNDNADEVEVDASDDDDQAQADADADADDTTRHKAQPRHA